MISLIPVIIVLVTSLNLTPTYAQIPPLKIVKTARTPNGFLAPPMGWNSFGLQANPAVNPSFTFNQTHVIEQTDALATLISQNKVNSTSDYYISLDSGWSIGDHGDGSGRITYDPDRFDIPILAKYLHSKGLKLGIYVLPGSFVKDGNKIIFGTERDGRGILIKDTWSGNNNGFARNDFDFTKKGVQEWHDEVVALFAEWYVFAVWKH